MPRQLVVTCGQSGTRWSANIEQRELAEHEAVSTSSAPLVSGQNSVFVVAEDGMGECRFLENHSVRVKVGRETASMGMCGGDPEVFASVWVDGRKVLSQHWFAAFCKEQGEDNVFRFDVLNGSLKHCQSPRSRSKKAAYLSSGGVCVRYPDLARFPRDLVEYPPSGKNAPAPGTIEIMRGRDAVCSYAAQTIGQGQLTSPDSEEANVDLPGDMNSATMARFDFDNDGRMDTIYTRNFENTYQHGAVLLVLPGSVKAPPRSIPAMEKSGAILLPCQWDKKRPKISQCAPFSQGADETGVDVKSDTGAISRFRSRYTDVEPFIFKRKTYIRARSYSSDTLDHYAVLEPRTGARYEIKCLLRKVQVNY
ncbi:hypothetical protein [Pseudoduganella rhizocola]|uniref:hypothetical protein n=1 Tax=Pseudoduganella rhizocola TaxID=3382643 RepID=UPI0038B57BEE